MEVNSLRFTILTIILGSMDLKSLDQLDNLESLIERIEVLVKNQPDATEAEIVSLLN